MSEETPYKNIPEAWQFFVTGALRDGVPVQKETYHGMEAAFISGGASALDVYSQRIEILQRKHPDAPFEQIHDTAAKTVLAELTVAIEALEKKT